MPFVDGHKYETQKKGMNILARAAKFIYGKITQRLTHLFEKVGFQDMKTYLKKQSPYGCKENQF